MHRRTVLRGLGATLALPWLEAMTPRARAASVALKPPQRFAFIYTPNGYNQQTFTPKITGADWELTPALESLAGLRKEITLCSGLDRTFVGGTGVHAQCGACWLTSSPPSETLDGGFPTNTTLDQIIAREIGGETALPSIELSCNDFADSKETRYYECISWAAPGYAANVEKNPRAVFQRLFGTGGRPTRSVLDVVMADAKALQAKLGREDREKLGEYLESVRATEHRIELAESASKRLQKPPIPEPAGIPEERGDYLRLMGDLIVLAFQNDLTRVASLIVDPERWDSPRMFHGVFDKPQNHHVLTHTKGAEAKDALTKIDRFHVELFAHVVQRLREIPEGDGSLLDSCCVVMGSGLSDGDSHKYSDLEVLVAGRAGGRLKPGAHHHFAGQVPLANLWLTLAQAAGVKRERFADSTGIIPPIRA
jgi:hypothetical protein